MEDTTATEPLPWAPGADPYGWLTRKIFNLDPSESLEMEDPRRVRVKRAFFCWVHSASVEKAIEKFDFLDKNEVSRVYAMLNDTLSSKEKAAVRAFFLRSLTRPPPLL